MESDFKFNKKKIFVILNLLIITYQQVTPFFLKKLLSINLFIKYSFKF